MKRPTFSKELLLWKQGYRTVAGIDEVGRGAWAGPIVAAGVIFEKRFVLKGLNDSKKMTEKKRSELAEIIKAKALHWTVQEIPNTEIDVIGIGKANARVIDKVVNTLVPTPDYLLIDKAYLESYKLTMPWESIIQGDGTVMSIAAASVLAKVARDARMTELAQEYPEYGFDEHKGYGTRHHQEMLTRYSHCPLHRMSYKPISQMNLFQSL